jgi:haloalkane dehalogenase
VAFCESTVKPMAWEELSPQARKRSDAIRTPGVGEQMMLEDNQFVRQAFTGGVLTPVSGRDLPGRLPNPRQTSARPRLGTPDAAGRRARRAGHPH